MQQDKGKKIYVGPAELARCGSIRVIDWDPVSRPTTLVITGKGTLCIADPAAFCLSLVLQLDCFLLGQANPDPQWDWPIETYISALRELGVRVEVDLQKH